MAAKQKPVRNFSASESEALLELVAIHKDVIENRKRCCVFQGRKAVKIEKKITGEFNYIYLATILCTIATIRKF